MQESGPSILSLPEIVASLGRAREGDLLICAMLPDREHDHGELDDNEGALSKLRGDRCA